MFRIAQAHSGSSSSILPYRLSFRFRQCLRALAFLTICGTLSYIKKTVQPGGEGEEEIILTIKPRSGVSRRYCRSAAAAELPVQLVYRGVVADMTVRRPQKSCG